MTTFLSPLFAVALIATPSFAEDIRLSNPQKDEAEVSIIQDKSSVTVRVVKSSVELPNQLEMSFIDKKGRRQVLNLGAVNPRVLERPSLFRGEYRSNQESFAGLEIRIPLPNGVRVLKRDAAQEKKTPTP